MHFRPRCSLDLDLSILEREAGICAKDVIVSPLNSMLCHYADTPFIGVRAAYNRFR